MIQMLSDLDLVWLRSFGSMSNASLKEQLQALAGQLPMPKKVEKTAVVNKESAKSFAKGKPSHPKKKMSQSPQTKKNTKPKPQWLEQALYGVELLRAYFPACFTAPNQVKPLKKGIKQDLVKRLSTLDNVVTEDKACMIKSLAYYVNTNSYHKSVIEGVTRVDLDGAPAGHVTAEEAKYSADRHQAKLQAKQKPAATQPVQVAEGNPTEGQST